ncbi:hypothetical protein LIN78_09525 [Leeia sp. TBRC 13508]|uniref:Uncharacterized protein n=1 Tax=Leeia speluncae TaxID=2884804 RepID=A0ABS8D6G2_9NEIS|nr:hypothetical protein [Leeia speluncae]MCB6183785.1 hypothetical protein [Leeia speluncae]
MTADGVAAVTHPFQVHVLRANHPTRPLALWLSYTGPQAGTSGNGEVAAAFFDGEHNAVWHVRQQVPNSFCRINYETDELRLDESTLTPDQVSGSAPGNNCHLFWDLQMHPLTEQLQSNPLLSVDTESVQSHLMFNGTIWLDGEPIEVRSWFGSRVDDQGQKTFRRLAWAQVVGFDNNPHAFFECSTQRMMLGAKWSPWMSMFTLTYAGSVYAINSLCDGIMEDNNSGSLVWRFDAKQAGVRIQGQVQAPAAFFARFTMPGVGAKDAVMHTKLANCIVTLTRPGKTPATLSSLHRASFEMSGEKHCLGVSVVTCMPETGLA